MERYKNLLTSTTLIPLWAKAVESVSSDPILMDRQALHILKSLGYGLDYYDKKKQNASQVGCCLRSRWIDDHAIQFIRENQPCQVIQLGAGLDDRFRRLGMPEGVRYWYDLDLKEVAEMRREVIPEVERNEIISMDLFETAWMERLRANNLPTLLIIEGVMMFLSAEKLTQWFDDVSSHLGLATLLYDSVPLFAVGKAKYHDSVRKYNPKVEYTWGLKEGKEIEKMSPYIHELETVRMSDLPGARKFIWPLRLFYRIPYFYRNANQLLCMAEIHPYRNA